MDYQGTPVGATNQGQKVTTDPRSNNYINESTGAVAKDSLAAESYRQGGGFADNRDSRPSDVSGSSSTWNTTDTSGASTLDAAPSAARRQDESGSTRYPEAVGGQGHFSGKHNDGSGGYAGGPSSAGKYGGSSGTSSGSGSGGYGSTADTTGGYSGSGADSYASRNAGDAPNYTLNAQGAFQGSKPKGNNITEGGFTGEGTNYNSGIGTRDDPGRAALQGLANNTARVEPSGPYQGGRAGNEQPFDALNNNERA